MAEETVYVIGKCALHETPDRDCRVCTLLAAHDRQVAEQAWAAVPDGRGQDGAVVGWVTAGREGYVLGWNAALAAVADDPGLVGVLARALREHQPTTGMSVAMGVTCRCGYWNGNEVGGTTRPVGYQGLQWHQANVQADVVRAWMRGVS